MTNIHKAAEMALAKLEHLWDIGIDAEFKVELLPEIEALRQALAQPEQEPYFCKDCGKGSRGKEHIHTCSPQVKRGWVGLTNDERNEMIGKIQHDRFTRQRDLIGSTQIITEMYLKEKNGG